MSQARSERCSRDPRLARVNLPRMEIENGGPLLGLVDAAHRPTGETIGQQSEEATAARGQAATGEIDGGNRQLDEAGIDDGTPSEARRFDPAIMVVADRG